MRCFGKKEEKGGGGGGRKAAAERHHSEPQSSEFWTTMNGGSPKKSKKRRKSSADPRRRMSVGSEKTATGNGQIVAPAVDIDTASGSAEGGLEFSKITERIFALLFPSGSDGIYRQNIKSISERIRRTFPDRYKIFNLSQKRSDLGRANQQGAVLEFGWPDTLAPPLDRLCSICKQLENHLNAAPENVAIVHCKGGLYRAGIVIAAFMNYTSICSGEENLPDRFSMKLFTEKYLGADAQPSYKRYVKYFANLLSGTTKVFPSAIFLQKISLNKLFPNRTVKLKLYERMKPVWSSGKISLKEQQASIDLSSSSSAQRLSLRGDVLLKCYEPSSSHNEKHLLFLCQFNTCALGLNAMALPRVVFHKEDLDLLFNDNAVPNTASLELAFELPASNGGEPRRSHTPKRGKSASPGRANLPQSGGGGDFSRADSYENFDRAEDDRSLSLPLGTGTNGQEKADELHAEQQQQPTLGALEPQPQPHQAQLSSASSSHQHTPLTADGADSGIGSDSPKAATTAGVLLNGQPQLNEENNEEEGTKARKMPPPVPPKVRRHSSIESVESQQPLPAHHHPQDENEPIEADDPLRSAFEDSTIGRDHSVLPPGVRPNRRHSTHQQEGNSGSSGDESARPPPRRRVMISPMVQPELVASGRYDPNSRCFSYVPAKSLKQHYQAPKKPALKRRTSIVEPADLEVSPLEAKMGLHNFGLQGSSSDLRRRAETPKWEAEIDKVTGTIEPLGERRPRRASTSGTPVGHLQRDFVRSPSAQIRPQDEWRARHYQPRQYQYQQQHNHPHTPPHWNWSSVSASRPSSEQQQKYLPNGYGPPSGTGSEWTTPVYAASAPHTVPRQQMPPGEQFQQQFRPMSASMAAERPTVVDQAKRATPTPVARYSPQLRAGRPIPGVRPSPRRSDMDELCDPDFYLSYSTPTSSPALGRKQHQEEVPRRMAQPGEESPLSKSVPNDRAFRQIGRNELLNEDVRALLAQHTMPVHFGGNRSQTPQALMLRTGPNRLNSSGGGQQVQDEYRAKHSRSVNSTPLIGGRKLFVHNDPDEPATDPEMRGAEDWLHSKMAALKTRRHMEPMARNRREAEKMLLEELKSKAAKLVIGERIEQQRGGDRNRGDPLEEYRREEQRLKNTQSPLVLDGLRQANKSLQKERARMGYYGQNPQQQNSPAVPMPAVPQPIAKSFPSGTEYPDYGPFGGQQQQLRSLSATPGAIVPMPSEAHHPGHAGTRPFHPQPMAESPTPSASLRRGLHTPTGPIVRGKPPTPPPIRGGGGERERSKSPFSASKVTRGASNSAPPPSNAIGRAKEAQNPAAAVNPNLLALRQSLYAKERERMGIRGEHGGQGGADWNEAEWGPEEPEEKPHRQWATSPLSANAIRPNRNPSNQSTFAYGSSSQNYVPSNSNGSGTGQHRSTPVKPILKRSNGQNGNGTPTMAAMIGGNESPMLQRRQMQQHSQPCETPDEESFVQRRPLQAGHPHPQAQPHLAHSSTSSNWPSAERSDTPQFPVQAERETPLPFHPLLYRRSSEDQHQLQQQSQQPGMPPITTAKSGTLPFVGTAAANNSNRLDAMTPHSMYGAHGPTSGFSRRSSLTSIEAGEVIHHHPVFVKDTSRFWYKPTISREEAINMLKNKPPGTFVVRDSNSFPGAFGLALKVAQPPAGVATTDGSELVRHFLIEPSTKGVRLKGCSNEPVFGTLAALVYQHSITPLALPCRLILPEYDPASSPEHINTSQALLERGAACNVSFLCSVDTESLTGPEAVRRSTAFAFELLQRRELRAVPVHFKVSSQGVTLTDNTRSLFFRRHYPVNSVTFAGIDPESRVFDNNHVSQLPPTYVRQAPVFGFVARKLPANGYNGSVENACHIFAELDPDQPASAVVRFITNVMMPAGRAQLQQIHQNANTH